MFSDDPRLVEQRIVIGLGHLEDREPQRLAGNRAAMGAEAADVRRNFDHRGALAAFGGLHGRPLAAGARAENHHVVMGNVHKTTREERVGLATITRSLSTGERCAKPTPPSAAPVKYRAAQVIIDVCISNGPGIRPQTPVSRAPGGRPSDDLRCRTQ